MGRIEGQLPSNRVLLARLAADLDGEVSTSATDAGLVKNLVMAQSIATVVQEALSLTSNHGLSRRNPFERHLRDVLCGRPIRLRRTASGWLRGVRHCRAGDERAASGL